MTEGPSPPRTPEPTTRRPRLRPFVALSILAVAFVVGAVVELNPDFDVTFGVEAWRRAGPLAAATAAAVVALLIASPRAARIVADAAAAAVRAILPRARLPLLLAATLAAFLALPDMSLSGDAMSAVSVTAARQVHPSNALTCWLHIAAASLLGLDPVESVRVVSWAAGLAAVGFGVALARALFDDAPRRTAAAFLLLTTGNAALFFGSVEVYAPLGAGVLAYLLVAVRAVRGKGSPHLPPFVLGVAFTLHGSAGLLLPSLVLLAGNAWGESEELRPRLRRIVRAIPVFLVPLAAAFLALLFLTWHGRLPSSAHERWGTFLGAEGVGPLLPLRFDPARIGPRYAFLDAEHALAALSTLFLAAPAAWAVLAALRLAPGRGSPPFPLDRRLTAFAVAALVPWIVYPFVWNVSYGLRRDWDMFSTVGVLAAFAASIVALRDRDDRAAAVRTAALCLFSFVPFVVSNAGGFADRRAFAQIAANTIEAASDVRGEAARAASVRRWDEETRRNDVTGSAALIDEGDAFSRAGRLSEAALKYDAAVAAEPTNFIARICRGLTLERLRRRDDARRDFIAALATPSEHVRTVVRHALGRMALEDGDAREAARQLDRALHEWSSNPIAPSIARELAQAWRRLGLDEDAAALDRAATERTRR